MADRDRGLRETPLHGLHQRLGARMAPFAGWDMPVSYPEGTVAEHLHTRAHASLFDVAHMGVVELLGDQAAEALEELTPAGVVHLSEGRQRYGLLTNDDGGIVDDVMIANRGDALVVIVNAARRDHDLTVLRESLPGVDVAERTDLGLVALQGPDAEAVLARDDRAVTEMRFMDARWVTVAGLEAWTSRSGYTGEDGFEMIVPADGMDAVAEHLLADERVQPAGLGARDTLRLEAGLCLYGNDLDEATSPVEADLTWTIPKRRRADTNYPGAKRVRGELTDGPQRIRVGLRPGGRKPVRAGAVLRPAGDDGAAEVGTVTSGGWSPTTRGPVAMGYVTPDHAEVGRQLAADVRGTEVTCEVAALPFVPHRYRR